MKLSILLENVERNYGDYSEFTVIGLTITHPNTRNEINLRKRMRRMKLSALEECIGETANNIKLKKKILILNLLPGEHAWNDTRSISRYCHFKTMSFSAKKSLQSN
jgi:hypothetical protein